MSADSLKRMAKPPGRISGDNLAEAAYQHILHQILSGDLQLGQTIPRKEIAAELGMSLLPISEALRQLELESLVESDRRVGTRVRVPTPQDIRGYCTVREALETEASRLFNERARSTEREKLKSLASQLDKCYEESAEHPEKFSEARLYKLRMDHRNFHLLIAKGAACPYLELQIEKNQNLVFNSFYDRLFGDRRLPFQWHGLLANALCDGDINTADKAARRHIRHHLEEIMYRLEPFLSLNPAQFTASVKKRKKQ